MNIYSLARFTRYVNAGLGVKRSFYLAFGASFCATIRTVLIFVLPVLTGIVLGLAIN